METQVEKVLQEASIVDADYNGSSSVVGVVAVNALGLCLGTQGEGDPSTAGTISALASLAAQIQPDLGENPVLVLETDKHQYLIKKEESVTVAVIKSASGN